MSTIDERFHVLEGGVLRRIRRDINLVRFLISIAWQWLCAGGRVRRAYRRAIATGETFYIDALSGRGKYD